MPARSVDRDPVKNGGAQNHVLCRFARDPGPYRRSGKDRGPALTTLGQLGSEAKGAIEQEARRVPAIEFTIEIVASDQEGELVAKEVLLNPPLFQRAGASRLRTPWASPAKRLG